MASNSIEQFPSQEALDALSKHWGLSDLVFIRKMENIVFSCQSPSGKAYLRLTTPLRRKKPEIAAELHWIEHLAKSGLRVPKILPDLQGKQVVSITDGSQHFEAVVFLEIKGEHPKETHVTNPQFLETLGSLIGKMHLASELYESSHLELQREEWFEERGLRHALTAGKMSIQKELFHSLEQAILWMKQLPRTSKNYGLVHADLGALNMFIGDDNTISVIDFDDSCYHWYAFDLAIVIFSMASRFEHTHFGTDETQWLEHLLKGYRKVRPFSEKEALLIPRFVHFAVLRLFFWIAFHETIGSFHKDALEKVSRIKKWTKQWAERNCYIF